MAHVSCWAYISVRNNDNSVSNWSLDGAGRLVNPPKGRRRRFESGQDGSYQPASNRCSKTTPEVQTRPNNLYVQSDSDVPEVLDAYDVEYPMSYINEPLDDTMLFGIW